jgi:hypothetical protein
MVLRGHRTFQTPSSVSFWLVSSRDLLWRQQFCLTLESQRNPKVEAIYKAHKRTVLLQSERENYTSVV